MALLAKPVASPSPTLAPWPGGTEQQGDGRAGNWGLFDFKIACVPGRAGTKGSLPPSLALLDLRLGEVLAAPAKETAD